jgi:DNA-binding Lrp family transcriptional regulator
MLGEKERIVLAASCLDADLSIEAIAERTALKPHVVRRALQAIESSGVVQLLTYIDVYPLGFFYYEVFIGFQPGCPNKAKILHLLENSPQISYIEQISGRFEYKLNVIARDPFEVTKVFDQIGELFPRALAEKKILLIESLVDYSLRFLAPQITGRRALGFGNSGVRIEIDELDHAILQRLSKPVVRNVSDLARTLGAKLSTVQYRLDRLKQNRVIVGTRYFANLFRLGYHLFDIHVLTRGRSQSVRDAMYAFADQEPAVFLLIQCVGEWDFTMCAAVESGQAVDDITERLSVSLGSDLQRVTTQTVIKHHKLCFYPLERYQGPSGHGHIVRDARGLSVT